MRPELKKKIHENISMFLGDRQKIVGMRVWSLLRAYREVYTFL